MCSITISSTLHHPTHKQGHQHNSDSKAVDHMAELFGPGLKAQLLETANLPEVPDEAKLLQAVVDKVGPNANKEKLLWHLRASRGKVHWAVNSYLRAVLGEVPPVERPSEHREDFDPPGRTPTTHQHPTTATQDAPDAAALSLHASTGSGPTSPASSSSSGAGDRPAAAAAAATAVQLDSLPGNVLEQVLSCLDVASLLSAACSCQVLHRAAQAEGLWRGLFQARWGGLLFPVNTHGSSRGGGNASYSVVASAATAAAAAALGVAGASASAAAVGPGQQRTAPRAPVPLFASGGAHQAHASPPRQTCPGSSSHPAGSCQQQQQQQQHCDTLPSLQQHSLGAQPCTSPPSSDIVSRWTSSSCAPPCSGTSSQQHHPSTSAAHSSLAAAPPAAALPAAAPPAAVPPATAPPAAPTQTCRASKQPPHDSGQQTPPQQLQQQQLQASQVAGQLPSAAPSGSWQRQFKEQYAYQASRTCPKCGASRVVPVVYGFPSPSLLAGMMRKRLVLGGDHLIESCHVWACAGCRSCFRFYPYVSVELWLQDDAAQQRRDHARAAAASDRRSWQDSAGAAGEQQQLPPGQQQPAGSQAGGSDAAGAGFPRYTYEL